MTDRGDDQVVLEHVASGAQQRLWFIEQLTPGHPVHNINVEFDLGPDLDIDLFTGAVGDVVQRHESLRTVFREDAGELYQVVLARLADLPVAQSDLSGEPDPQMAWERLRMREARRIFDLARGPLLFLHVARVAPGRHHIVLVMHHAVTDAWSSALLLRDLGAAYRARRHGTPPDLPPLPVQYADFTAWQQQRRTTAEAEADLAYWRAQLADVTTIDLTRGRPRTGRLVHDGAVVSATIPGERVEALRAAAAADGATLFMALTTLWAEAVGRWFGTVDVPLGTPIAGRPLPDVADLVGLFVDRVVLRVDTSGRLTFRELMRRTRGVVIDALDHTSVTFEQVIDAVRPARTIGLTPLFQVGINLVPLTELSGRISNGTVRHDLNLDMFPDAGGLATVVEYRQGVVSPQDAAGVADLFARLVAAVAADSSRALGSVSTLPDPQGAVRGGGTSLGDSSCVPALVAVHAARTPDAPAVVTPRCALSYAQLVANAHTLAHHLVGLGVGPETLVVLAIPRRAELIVGMLGVLAAGGAYVPVDPGAPARHLAVVAGEVGARVALVAAGARVPLPAGVRAVEVTLAATADPGCPVARTHPANAAYILYTSGTTGVPKGIVVEHRQLVAYARAVIHHIGAAAGSSYLMVQPPTFDSCGTQIYGALLSGGVLHLVDEDTARDPVALGDYCDRHPIDYLKIVPSHLSALLAGGDDRLRPRRALIVGGEGCAREFVRGLTARGWPVVGHYGPTETTIGVLAHRIGPDTGAHCITTPLGPPMAGVHVCLLDDRLDPVPVGCPSELYVGGDLVARGYAGRGGRTAERFVPDPYATTPGARMYRTGDTVRELPDGTFEFLGRADRQIKLNGHRVEPGAVEAVLARHRAVRQAVVVARDGRLIAYVVLSTTDGTPTVDEADLRAHVAAELPAINVPAMVVTLDVVPQKPNGKVDYGALPEPVIATAVTWVAPASPTETSLAGVYAGVLGLDTVSVTDRFFDLGGDSIGAIHLVAEARRVGLPIAVRDVFERQSVRALAAMLDETGAGASGDIVGAQARQWWSALLGGAAAVIPRLTGTVESTRQTRLLPPQTVADLAGPAHVAYGTTVIHLLLAAVAGVLAEQTGLVEVAVLVQDESQAPVPVVVTVADGDTGRLVGAAKTAVRETASRADEWLTVRGDEQIAALGLPDVTVGLTDLPAAPGQLTVSLVDADLTVCGPCPADTVAHRLVALTRDCARHGETYTVEDFPDSGLDATQLDRLLANLGVDRSP